jgi:hypothetical protein
VLIGAGSLVPERRRAGESKRGIAESLQDQREGRQRHDDIECRGGDRQRDRLDVPGPVDQAEGIAQQDDGEEHDQALRQQLERKTERGGQLVGEDGDADMRSPPACDDPADEGCPDEEVLREFVAPGDRRVKLARDYADENAREQRQQQHDGAPAQQPVGDGEEGVHRPWISFGDGDACLSFRPRRSPAPKSIER